MPEYIEREAIIYKKAFEIAVRCARELNGTPELKEAYQEAQKDNRALNSFMAFCLEKAAEEIPEHTTADVVEVVRCGLCKNYAIDREKGGFCKRSASPSMWRDDITPLRPDDFCSYGEKRETIPSAPTE